MEHVAATKRANKPIVPVEGQSFYSEQDWVNRARKALTNHPDFRDTEHPKRLGWQGPHFKALCFDQLGRRCRNGGDMMRATREGSYPIWWVWPDQIAELLMKGFEHEVEIARLRSRRLLLVESDCAVRDDRWIITIDASGDPCSITVKHKEYGDFYDWPESAMGPNCHGGACPAADRAYTLQDESNYRSRSAALRAAHDFLRRFGSGEIEYLEWDVDSQSMVVVGHGSREGMRGWKHKDWGDKPCPLASFYKNGTAEVQP